ncbi:hypothetical protein BDV24DRAFT_123844 [Aspergillus arachidicola]|uniref:Uncharacterized protein n=1 Tax=Aspergillus arachidicola TaxID=656916 RepID=A0A5N6YS73_9EURO|nr:hypothetical protein BDV24DRAFT_123844 [Aspergillus arachidicola]
MWAYIQEFLFGPTPPSVTITGARFPADGSPPHLVSLNTTSQGVSEGPDSFLHHVPDLRSFWKTSRAWKWRDINRFNLENQPFPNCNGVYMLFFSFDLDELPLHKNVVGPLGERSAAGDAFVVKLKSHEYGENGWAEYDDVSPEFLELPIMTRQPSSRIFHGELI